jgi:hypothetical protein
VGDESTGVLAQSVGGGGGNGGFNVSAGVGRRHWQRHVGVGLGGSGGRAGNGGTVSLTVNNFVTSTPISRGASSASRLAAAAATAASRERARVRRGRRQQHRRCGLGDRCRRRQ